MLFENKGNGVEFIIAGLGNPGSQYDRTRHNSGFAFMDWLSGRTGIKTDRLKHMGLCGKGTVNGHQVLLIKPQTYMNESGECVADAASFYKIPPERVIAVFDDCSLEPGRIRVRRSGSAGGHNGVKSLIERLGTDSFPRIKIGVGEKPRADYDLADWVLGKLSSDDCGLITANYDRMYSALGCIMDGDTEKAMQICNGKTADE